jgi:ABC-type transport system substrate-binding protein
MDRIVLVDTPDPVAQLDLLRSGNLDILLSVGPDAFERLSTDRNYVSEQFAPIQCPNLTLLKGTLGPDGRSLSENRSFTQALKYAIDYDRIADLFGGWENGAFPAQPGFVPGISGYDKSLAGYYRCDPQRSTRLLAEAGYAGGLGVEFTYWEGSWGGVDTESVVKSIARDLESVGVKPELRSYSGEEYFSLLLDQRALTGVTLSMSIYQMPDPEDVFRRKTTYLDLTGYQYGMERALDAAAAEGDPEKRQGMYRSLQLEFLEVSPMIFLLTYPHRVVRRTAVSGYVHDAHKPGPRLSELGLSEPSR